MPSFVQVGGWRFRHRIPAFCRHGVAGGKRAAIDIAAQLLKLQLLYL